MEKSSKIWLGITGILLVVVGILCFVNPGATLFTMAVLIGCLTLASGISRMVFTFRTQAFLPNSGTRMLSALLQIIVGFIFLFNSIWLAISLPIIFALWVMFEGIVLFIQSFDYKKFGFPYWWVLMLLGIAGAVLGCLGLYHLDASGITLTWLFGLGLVLIGVAHLVALCGINRFESAVKDQVDQLKKGFSGAQPQA